MVYVHLRSAKHTATSIEPTTDHMLHAYLVSWSTEFFPIIATTSQLISIAQA